MEETCEVAMIHGRDLRDGCTGGGDGGWVSGAVSPAGATSSGSSSSLFSSTSGLTDDEDGDATSSLPVRRRISSSSLTSSESSDTMQTDGGDAGDDGPLYELSTMLDHLPALRTGLSKYYQGRSQSFTSLADVSCVEDLAKKTTPYIRRTKASRGYAAALGLSKTIAKKAPRGSPVRPMWRGRNTSGKPPAYQGKREVYSRTNVRSRPNVGSCK